MKKVVGIISFFGFLSVFVIGFSYALFVELRTATGPSDTLGGMVAGVVLAASFIAVALWSSLMAGGENVEVKRGEPGETMSDGSPVAWSVSISTAPGDRVPAYLLLVAGVGLLAGAVALFAAHRVGPTGAGVMGFVGALELRYCWHLLRHRK
ncbi:hypothetical protein [Pseudonocardia acaciae]|uniref:hypothetical protein n=1 Tax=Pseudonocardia acaciae TaxID=551276 RepID=UPI000491B4FF|nr:hypothetical protein [Pseudonocardia acaciae]